MRILLKKTIFLVMFSLLLSDVCIAQDAEEYFQRGVGYFETRLIDKAIAEFKKALPLFKEDQMQMKAEAYTALANAYNRKGIHKASITACKKATSEDIEEYITTGDNYFNEGKFDEAIAEYKKALEIKPRDDILNKLGQVHQQKRLAGKSEGQPAKMDTFTNKEKSLDTMPGLTVPHETEQDLSIEEFAEKGISYYNKGLIDKAIEEFKEVIELDPVDVGTHYHLGNAYADKGMFDDAMSEFKRVIELNAKFIDAFLSLGTLYLDMEMATEAISLYKEAINANPDDSFLRFHLGEAYALNEQHSEAITAYNNAISLNPMDPETQYRLAESYYQTKQYDMALKHATQSEKLGYITDPAFM